MKKFFKHSIIGIIVITLLSIYTAKISLNLENENINCYVCSKGTKKYEKPDKYILALSKLYEEELENNRNNIVEEVDENKSEKEKIEERKRKRKIWFQNKNKKTN